MLKKTSAAAAAVFIVFVAGFFLAHVSLPDRSFSERENRYLETFPRFSLSSLFSGDFTAQFERYSSDQFPLRDAWVTLKAALERAGGKSENNGVFLCAGGMLIEAYHAPDPELVQKNTEAVNALAEHAGVPVHLALIPEKSELYAELLPKNAPNVSQREMIDGIYANTTAETADLLTALSPHKNEYIFYRTDHHWTVLGAYYGYTALSEAMGLPAEPLSAFVPETVSEDFYGTSYSSSGFTWVAPDLISLLVPDPGDLTIRNYLDGTAQETPLYDRAALEKKDKYTVFLGGNTPLLQIETGVRDGGSVLLLRDSYADSLVPFLLSSFSEIHMIDLRYYKGSIEEYIREQEIDRVLVLYSVSNFTSDGNISLMSR